MLNKTTSENRSTETNFPLLPILTLGMGLLLSLILLVSVFLGIPLIGLAGGVGVTGTFLFIFCFPAKLKRRIKYLSVLLTLIILPFQNTLNLVVGFSIRALILVIWALFFVDLILVLFSSPKRVRQLSFFEQMALVLSGWAVIYLPVSFLVADSLLGGIQGFLVQFQGIFAYFVVRSLKLTERQTKKILLIMLISLVVMVGYGFYEFIWGQYQLIDWLVAHSNHPYIQQAQGQVYLGYYRQLQSGIDYYRAQSFELEFVSFGYSGYVLSSCLLAVVLLSRRWRKSPWLWMALLASALGLISSVTLSAIAIFFFSFWFIGWEALRHRGNAKYVWILMPILAIISLISIWFISPHTFAPVQKRLEKISLADRSQVHLIDNQKVLAQVLPQVVLIGRGTGTSGPGSGHSGYFIEQEYAGNAAEWSWLGLGIYMVFMFSLLRHIIRLKRRYQWGSLGYALGTGLLCVTIGYLLIGFYHNVWGQSSIDVQFMILLILWTQGRAIFSDVIPGNKKCLKRHE